MSLKLKILCIFVIVVAFSTLSESQCPNVTPMANFSPTRFLGVWYAIYRYKTIFNGFRTSCIAMNATTSNRNVINLDICNLFSQRTPVRILGTLASSGVVNLKYQLGIGKRLLFSDKIIYEFDSQQRAMSSSMLFWEPTTPTTLSLTSAEL